MRAAAEKLHATLCSLTGRQERFCFHERSYAELLKFYSQDEAGVLALETDLRLVIRYLRVQIAKSSRNLGCLKLRNLLAVDRFDEDLAEARSHFRKSPAQQPPSTPPAPTVQTPTAIDWDRRVAEIAALKSRL